MGNLIKRNGSVCSPPCPHGRRPTPVCPALHGDIEQADVKMSVSFQASPAFTLIPEILIDSVKNRQPIAKSALNKGMAFAVKDATLK